MSAWDCQADAECLLDCHWPGALQIISSVAYSVQRETRQVESGLSQNRLPSVCRLGRSAIICYSSHNPIVQSPGNAEVTQPFRIRNLSADQSRDYVCSVDWSWRMS